VKKCLKSLIDTGSAIGRLFNAFDVAENYGRLTNDVA
jgi:hypothetical protein